MIDRHYEEMDDDKLLNAHSKLWNSLHRDGTVANITKRDMLNLLLEYERELAFREKERG